jgi:hypothetical protein
MNAWAKGLLIGGGIAVACGAVALLLSREKQRRFLQERYQQFAPGQQAVPGPVGPYAAQPPGVIPPLERKPTYPPQGQGYGPSPVPPPAYPANYARQVQGPPGPGQDGDSPPPPPDKPEQRVSPGVLIVLAVVGLLVLAGIVSLFYNIGQHSGSQPGSTPTHAATAVPTHAATPVPTHTPRSAPTRTPGNTPTPTAFRASTSGEGQFAAALARHRAWQVAVRRT